MDLSEAGQISASAQPNTEVSLSLRLPTGEAPGETVQVHNIEDKYVNVVTNQHKCHKWEGDYPGCV